MPRFIHLDTSIQSIGGHHWDLASNIADIANKSGWSASIATNIRFREVLSHISVAPNINVIPVLDCPQSWRFSNNDMGGTKWQVTRTGRPAFCIHPSKIIGTISGLVKSPSIRDTQGAFQSTKQAFLDFLNKEELSKGDFLFFGTACELDLLCFSEALREYSKEINWHTSFYFHYGVFPSTKSSKVVPPHIRKENIKKMLRQAFKHLDISNISLFATTSQLAIQLTELAGVDCKHLHYPISKKFFESNEPKIENEENVNSEKLEVALAGGFRDEQGSGSSINVLSSIFSDRLLNDKIQISMMVDKSFCTNEINTTEGPSLAENINSLHLKQFPLSSSEYFSWLDNADACLFLYQAVDYANRVSGVFLEAIALEKPVIVLAPSWMSHYLDSLSSAYYQDILCDLRMTKLGISLGAESDQFEVSLEQQSEAQIMFVLEHTGEFDFELPILKIIADNSSSYQSYPFRRIGKKQWACITVSTQFKASTIFRFTNNSFNSNSYFEKISYCVLETEKAIPISYAGLVVENVACFTSALRELSLFQKHYLETTKASAKVIASHHHPKVFVKSLTHNK